MEPSHSALNRMRQEMGEFDPTYTVRSAVPSLGAVASAGGAPAQRLEASTRRFLFVVAVTAGLVAVLHGLLLDQLRSESGGWAGWGVVALSWPHPFAQPALAGGAAVVLIVMAFTTAGFTRVRRVEGNSLMAASVAALAGGLPTVVLVALILTAIVLLVVFVLFVFFMLIAGMSD